MSPQLGLRSWRNFRACVLMFRTRGEGNLVPRVFVPLDQRSENERLWEHPFQACAVDAPEVQRKTIWRTRLPKRLWLRTFADAAIAPFKTILSICLALNLNLNNLLLFWKTWQVWILWKTMVFQENYLKVATPEFKKLCARSHADQANSIRFKREKKKS